VRRWAKRLRLELLGLFAVLTIASVAYNAATAADVKPATALYAGLTIVCGPWLSLQARHALLPFLCPKPSR